MTKSLLILRVGYFLSIMLMLISGRVLAQTDADAIMIPKNYFCAGAMYSNSSWTNYWEGTFKRNNLNLGTISTQMYTLMANYGISDKLNLLVGAPYVVNRASAGTLAGMHGIQDLSATLKWMPVETQLGNGLFSLYGIGTASIPLNNYVADYMPMSIGMHSRSLSFRAMADYQYKNLFFTGSGQYVNRSIVTIDRTSYYTTTLIYSNQVAVPNASVVNLRAGYRSSSVIAEAIFENSTTLGGFDIRKNDMPFLSNRMNSTAAGVNFKYSFGTGLELTAGGSHVLAGRNVGQSTMFHGGAYYLLNLKKKGKEL